MSSDLEQIAVWRKSSRSNGSGGQCVEVGAGTSDIVGVRDTKNRSSGTLVFSGSGWSAFLADVKAGEFDR